MSEIVHIFGEVPLLASGETAAVAEADAAIARALATMPDKAQRCIACYAQRNGWKPT